MPNIFQLKTNELVSLLKVLKPDSTLITDDALITSGGFELNKKLRSQITEWLLINNFSTMIQFHKDPCTEAWVIPNKNDSISCGKYRVAQKVPLIIPDPILMESSLFNANCDIKRKIEPLNLIPLMWDKSNKIETRSATDRVLMQSFKSDAHQGSYSDRSYHDHSPNNSYSSSASCSSRTFPDQNSQISNKCKPQNNFFYSGILNVFMCKQSG